MSRVSVVDLPAAELAPAAVSRPASRGERIAAPTFAIIVTVVLAAMRLVVNPRFYYADDTQTGTLGQLYEIGDRLMSGQWLLLSPHAWTGGNYAAEGQWGLYNPLIWIVGLLVRMTDDPVLSMTAIKVFFLAVMTVGVYLLARSFGSSCSWAAVAGVLAPAAGFTVYMDSPSWTSGLMTSALLPLAWWALRRTVEEGRSPLAYLISTYLLITLGYVFGVLVLVLVLAESLVRAVVRWDTRLVVRNIMASAFGALLTVTVYLPGILTAPVTVRNATQVANFGFLNADLSDMMGVASPTASMSIGSWYGDVTQAPLTYIAWALPAMIMFLPISRAAIKGLVPLFVVGAVVLLIVVGPSDFGPLRWPVRMMPYLAIVAVVIFAVIATRGFPQQVTGRKLIAAGAVVSGLAWFGVATVPAQYLRIGAGLAVQLFALVLVYLIARTRWDVWRREVAAAATIVLTTGVLLVPQLAAYPATPLPTFAIPGSTSEMNQVLDDGVSDAFVVGDIYAGSRDPATFDERLMANLWYLAATDTSAVYTVLPHAAYSADLCSDLRGSTCSEALQTLLSTDPQTGSVVADLLGVNTIVVMKSSFDAEPDVPNGWNRVSDGDVTWVFVRNEIVPTAGGVVWESEGTSATILEQTDTTVRLRVDSVGADGRIALSRIDWPGYLVDGAEHAAPIRDYLLTVDVGESAIGDTVVIRFLPPGWWLEMFCLAVALVGGAAWSVILVTRRRRAGDVRNYATTSSERENRGGRRVR